VELELTEDTGVSVVITRDCVGVSCPDPSASACFGGRCVAQACWDGNPGACGDGECIADADCTSGLGCVVPICVSGACLMPTDHDRCASGQRCDIVLGCVGGPGDGGMCSGPEVCNGIDDDCDPGTVDGADDVTLGLDCDGPDADECDEGTTACVGGRGVCSDDTDDSAETCDGTDEDCDGTIDEGLDCRPGCTQMVRAGTTYLFCPDTLDWTEAFTACGEIGYHLVKIEDAEENDFLVTAALSIVFDDWWIGLNDRGREGEHIWHDGTNADAFSAWRRGQPDNDSNEDCDEINDVDMGAWNDRPCTYDSNFICEANPP